MLSLVCDLVWGVPTLLLILSFGIFLSIKTGFFQLRGFGTIFRNTLGSFISKENTERKNGISSKAAFCSVLAATMGTGNIIGVASAIIIGGPGAVFWMWISAVPGMIVVYAENFFGVKMALEGKKGGAVAYTEKALGRPVSVIYAVLCTAASFGMGNMVQSNSLSAAFYNEYGVPVYITGAGAAFLTLLVIVGGIKRISSFTEIFIPVISLLYIAAALFVVIKNYSALPRAFQMIFSGAFGLRAAGGGICGAALKNAVSTGLKRGVFSNEAGLGTSSVFHSSCSSRKPELQGMWGISEVFFDTVICCTLTALAILCTADTGSLSGTEPVSLVSETFSDCFGRFSGDFVCISVSLFAFATITGWSHCGETAFARITGNRFRYAYRIFYCLLVLTGASAALETVWTLSDIFNGLMIIPNIIALAVLTFKYGINVPEKNCQQ